MRLSRETEIKIKFILEQLLPPIIRDAYWFNRLPFQILFGKKSDIFLQFKKKQSKLNKEKFTSVYEEVDDVIFTKETDLNKQCINEILRSIKGKSVLEVGAGKGFLAKKLAKKSKVTAADIVVDPDLASDNPEITFLTANIESLPFKDKSFDTVVTTHTLEHVQNFFQAVSELRRVTKKRLIIVVPKERPYEYTFNLHLHFFPYTFSLLNLLGPNNNNSCKEVGGDLFYLEEMNKR